MVRPRRLYRCVHRNDTAQMGDDSGDHRLCAGRAYLENNTIKPKRRLFMKNRKLMLRVLCLSSIAMLIVFVTNALAQEMIPAKVPKEKQATASKISFPDGAA